MTDIQEWQQENAQRAFPFTESSRGADILSALPYDFIVDLRVFPDRETDNLIYLSSISYDTTKFSYLLTFRYNATEQVAIHSSVLRRVNGESRVGTKILLENGEGYPNDLTAYCILTPGDRWDQGDEDPMWIILDPETTTEDGVYTKTFTPEEATVDPNVIVPGVLTMRRIFIDRPGSVMPPVTSWGLEVTQSLHEGKNISFSSDDADPDVVIINAIGGAGEGYDDNSSDGNILYVNGVSANSGGSLKLGTNDCLNKIEKPNTAYPEGDLFSLITLENTIQLLSDCLPCCGCSKYRAVSAAITRRSRKLKELCDLLVSMITANSALYSEAVDKINAARTPLVRIRNIRVRETYFIISVQNICVTPVYAHIGITMTGGNGIYWGNFHTTSVDAPLIHNSLSELPPLDATTKDYDNKNPEIPQGIYTKFIVGSDSDGSSIKPIPPGGFTDITFNYDLASMSEEAALVFDIRDRGLQLRFESSGIYGAQTVGGTWTGTYGCKKDIYEVRVVEAAPTVRNYCGVTTVEINYKVIEI